jgi:Effector-associated domain 1
MKLSGEQCEQFRDALCDAFRTEDALVQMVRFKLGRNLGDDVGLRRPLKDETFDLITKADEEGWTEALIRGAYSSRSGNADLTAFLDRHFASLKTPVAAEQLIGSVRRGFDALTLLVQQLADPTVRSIVGRFRADFGAARDKSLALGRYKRLHDRLHIVQVGFPAQLDDAASELRSGKPPTHSLDLYAYQLRREADKCRQEAEGLDSKALEQAWITMLEQVAKAIDQARAEKSAKAADRACALLRQVLAEAPRINSMLTSTVADLRLGQLVMAMKEICDHLDTPGGAVAPGPVDQVRAGRDGLLALRPRLDGLMQEHYEWQILEKAFVAAETQPGDTPQERFLVWDDVRGRLAQLCQISPDKEWARLLTNLPQELEQAGAAANNKDEFERKFDTFRTVARERFVDVDTELLNQSTYLADVASPLDQLLKLVTNDAN